MVFSQLAKINRKKQETLFLGAPEAEAEALPNSKMPLEKVYKDYSGLIEGLSNEKFIIVGRKGSGKSAFAEHIGILTKSNSNMFAKFIKQDDFNLEKIVQLGEKDGYEVEKESLYKWLILTNLLKLFTDNLAIENNKDYNLLKQFLQRNSGFININESETRELIKTQGFSVNINYLKRFFSSKMNKSLEIKQERASFYKLIPHLKEVILKVLKSPENSKNKNSYVLFFDDLDIAFNAKNAHTVNSLTSLLRVSKDINNEFFAKNNLDSKVVILLREDISKLVSELSPDTAKIFTSYSLVIKWYQDEYHAGGDEKQLNIRRFINDRIRYAFEYESIPVDKVDPWLSLVEDPFEDSTETQKSSFKYILDHTFFRPRDLLLFFKPLSIHNYKFPLSKKDVNHLIGTYSGEVINELKNEFSNFYSSEQIATIFHAFGKISAQLRSPEVKCISYEKAINIIEQNCSDVNAADLLFDMYERSLIGSMGSNGFVYFKHREPSNDSYVLNESHGIIIHSALKVYCLNKGY